MSASSRTAPLRLAVLISGAGTTLGNLLKRVSQGSLSAEVVLVVSSNPDAGGLDIARSAGIESVAIEGTGFESAELYSGTVFDRCRAAQVDYVVMGGFLKHVPIPSDFVNRVINIHPALIPAFCGKGFYGERVHRAVLEYGARVSGCTVHFVDDQYDHGPIILQKMVPVRDDDTPESLAARVFEAECDAYPEAINLLARGAIVVEGRQVRIQRN